jgi:hypothetical protein
VFCSVAAQHAHHIAPIAGGPHASKGEVLQNKHLAGNDPLGTLCRTTDMRCP